MDDGQILHVDGGIGDHKQIGVENYTVFWFRRDLRVEDNAGLYHALTSGNSTPPLYFDTEIIPNSCLQRM